MRAITLGALVVGCVTAEDRDSDGFA